MIRTKRSKAVGVSPEVAAAASAMSRARWSKATPEDRARVVEQLKEARARSRLDDPESQARRGYGEAVFERLKKAGWLPRWARAQARRAAGGETHGPGAGECSGSYGLAGDQE